MILSHAEIYRGDPRSRNRISCCYEFLIARGVMLGAFSNSCECERSSRNVILISEFKNARNSAALARSLF